MVLTQAYNNFKRWSTKASNYDHTLSLISNRNSIIANLSTGDDKNSIFTCSLAPIKSIDLNSSHNSLFIRF